MNIDTSVNLDFRTGLDNLPFNNIVTQFLFLIRVSNELLREQLEWYETGYSKKQALSHSAFKDGRISDDTLLKWGKRYKKDFPLFVEEFGMVKVIIVMILATERCITMKLTELVLS
ncbi:hypothetical protein [Enterobacter hormaechei]|uniref:hypothetical protein n=1 Tax=Enterobacter hormaechei TaxID=158836 RepID=UPI0034D2F4A6